MLSQHLVQRCKDGLVTYHPWHMTHRVHASINTPCLWAAWCCSLCRGMPLPVKPPPLQLVVMAVLWGLQEAKSLTWYSEIKYIKIQQVFCKIVDALLFAEMSKQIRTCWCFNYSASGLRNTNCSSSVRTRTKISSLWFASFHLNSAVTHPVCLNSGCPD